MTLAHPPVFDDVDDLNAVADIPELVEEPDEESLRAIGVRPFTDDRHIAQERHRWRQWRSEALTLAAHGIHPAPSHSLCHGSDGIRRTTWGRGWWDVEELVPWLADRFPGQWHRGEPLCALAWPYDDTRPDHFPALPAGYDFYAVTTQSAGMLCHHPKFVCLPLPFHAEGFRTAAAVERFVHHDNDRCGLVPHTLTMLAEWRAHLDKLGLSGERTYHLLAEAVYPLAAEHVSVFSAAPIPTWDDFRAAIAADTPLENLSPVGQLIAHSQTWRDVERWTLVVLSENCD